MFTTLSRRMIILSSLILALGCGKAGSWKVDITEKEDGGGSIDVSPIKPKPFDLSIRDLYQHAQYGPLLQKYDLRKFGFQPTNHIWTNWTFQWPRYNGTQEVYGGLPQNADYIGHFAFMDKYFDVQCPDKDFSGYCIIDMEWWVPDLDSCPAIYKQKSIEKVLKENPTLSPTDPKVLQLATSQFNNAAQILMEQTLIHAKQLRPKGKWGYYGYPARCYFAEGGIAGYLHKQKLINDRYTKIWAVSDIIVPSLYVVGSYRSNNDPVKLEFNKTWAKENVEEGVRIAKGKPVICYIWYLYENDLGLQQEADYRIQLEAAYKYGANGVILWQHDYTETDLKKVVSFFEGVGGKVHRELGLIK